MSATDELRRLLDERRVEWTGSDARTGFLEWEAYEHYVFGQESGLVTITAAFTPEQAIEATLGRGECHDSNNRFNAWECSECGATVLLMFDDYDEPSYSVGGVADVPNFCPNCGRKVVDA